MFAISKSPRGIGFYFTDFHMYNPVSGTSWESSGAHELSLSITAISPRTSVTKHTRAWKTTFHITEATTRARHHCSNSLVAFRISHIICHPPHNKSLTNRRKVLGS